MSESEKLARLFGERLKAIRKEMKLKQSVFAHLIGTSDDTVSLIERGKILPRLETVCKIAERLKIQINKLLDFQEYPEDRKSANKPLSSLNLYLKAKSPADVQMLHDIAKNIFDKDQASYKKQRHKSFIMRDK